MQKRRVWQYWLFGALLTTAMFIGLKFLTNFRFENSDDILMVKAFMGFEGGRPADFSLYLHTLMAWALYGVSLVAPSLPWFSLLQLGLLYGSSIVLTNGLYQLAEHTRHPVIVGTASGAFFLAIFAAFISCRINFTTTATLAGAAAVVQMMTVDFQTSKTKQRAHALLPALLLLAAAYCLRAFAALPSLLFICGVLLWRLLPQQNEGTKISINWRPVLKTALLFTLILASLFAVRQAEIGLRGLRGYMRWNDANGALLDYTDFETNAAPAGASGSGLSAAEIKLVQQWYFLNGAIDEQAMWTMASAYETAQPNGWASLRSFFANNARYPYIAAILVLLCALSLLKLRRGAWSKPLLALASTAATFALLFWLARRGRLLYRAADSVLIPCAAFNLGLVLHQCKEEMRGRARKIAALMLAVFVAAAALGNLRLTHDALTAAPDTVSPQREADLEAYALQNRELLIVRTPNLLRDTRLFPDVSGGTPDNIIIWGDWLCRTPSWNRQLALFGFDAEQFIATDWLRDNIVFAALSPEDTVDLSAYLTEATGQTVAAEEIGAHGTLRFYRFGIV